MTSKQYKALCKAACQAAEILSGDCQYTDPAVNRVACESMVLGWLMGQAWFIKESARVRKVHPREDVFLTAKDKVLEAVTDAVGDCAIFDEQRGYNIGKAKRDRVEILGFALVGIYSEKEEEKQEQLARILRLVGPKTFENASRAFPDLRNIEA